VAGQLSHPEMIQLQKIYKMEPRISIRQRVI